MTGVRTGVGTSELADPAAAGRSAAAGALDALAGEAAALVLVYATSNYDLPALLAAVTGVTGTAPLVGATSCGLLHQGTLTEPGVGVAVLALGAGRYRYGVASVTGLAADPVAAGSALARRARAAAGSPEPAHATMLLLSDGLAGDPQGLLTGVHRVTGGSVPVVGGVAGDDRKLTRTFVFHGDRVLGDAAVAVWISSEQPGNVVVGHGWTPRGLPMMVTEVDGPIVHTIAGRPALEVFREHIQHDDPRNDLLPASEGGWYTRHALGLLEPDGTQLIRGAFLDDSGALRTFSPLPPFSAVQVVSCTRDDILKVGDRVVRQALAGGPHSVLLVFSCVARLDILGDRSAEEAALLQHTAGDIPTFGFYTYGEFARTTSVSGVHNATLAAIAL